MIFPRHLYTIAKRSTLRFIEDKCGVQARSLSYVSLLSLIPVLIVTFLVFHYFSFYPLLKEKMFVLLNNFVLPDRANDISIYLENIMDNIRAIGFFGTIIAVGMILVLIIELSRVINRIWKVREIRSFLYNVFRFLLFIIFSIILILLTFYLQNYMSLQNLFGASPFLSLEKRYTVRLLSLILHWILLSELYYFIPQGKKKVLYSFISGVFAGSLWYLVRWGLNLYVKIIPQINIIYGSLVFIPLFLLWLNFSWMIVLFGLELNYTFHFNRK